MARVCDGRLGGVERLRNDVSWRGGDVAGVGWRLHRTTLARRWERGFLSGHQGNAHGRAGRRIGSDVFQWHGATALPRADQSANFQYGRIQLRRVEGRLPIHREPVREAVLRASARYSAERDGLRTLGGTPYRASRSHGLTPFHRNLQRPCTYEGQTVAA